MKTILEYVKQASNFHFPRVVNEYLSTKVAQTKIKATDETIHEIVKDELDRLGHDANLNHIDVSQVTKMDALFSCHNSYDLGPKYADLNPDISQWDVSNVEIMSYMFWGCTSFNQDLSQWVVSKVKDMYKMFWQCKSFNQDISGWDVSNVEDMNSMFCGCENFNQDLSQWKVGNVNNMFRMFYGCKNFNQDISGWDVSKVKHYPDMFDYCSIKEEYKPHFVN